MAVSSLSEGTSSPVELNRGFTARGCFKRIENCLRHLVFRRDFEERIGDIRVDLHWVFELMLSLFDINHWLCMTELIITVVCEYLLVVGGDFTGLPLVGSLIPRNHRVEWFLADPWRRHIRSHALVSVVSLVLWYLRALYLHDPQLLQYVFLPRGRLYWPRSE